MQPFLSRRTAIKFCGITRPADALAAVNAGAHALGFNGYTGSKRYLNLHENAGWIRELPPYTVRVALLVNPTFEEAAAVMELGCFSSLQLHGDESPEFCAALQGRGIQLVKVLPVHTGLSVADVQAYPVQHILLDAPAPGAYGGTGRTVDWNLAARLVSALPDRRFILAGGLTPDNVAEAIRQVQPYAVDVASGIEQPGKPGLKDEVLMQAFGASVWQADEAALGTAGRL